MTDSRPSNAVPPAEAPPIAQPVAQPVAAPATPPSDVPPRIASSGGIELAVHDLGGSGRPVLAAHATGFNALVWRPLARALDDAHVVAPDLRAHGRSRVGSDTDLDWDRFADDVLATIDALGWASPAAGEARPVGIGHSMGGAALLLAEQRRPGTFAGLWVYEPIIFPPEIREQMGSADNPLAVGAKKRRPVFASREDAIATYGSKPPMNTFDLDALTAYVEGGFTDEPDGTIRLACVPDDESRTYVTATTCTAFEHLADVACPVMVVRGVLMSESPAAIAEPAAQALPRGILVTHDELSHFGPMENPAGLAAEISEFLTSLH